MKSNINKYIHKGEDQQTYRQHNFSKLITKIQSNLICYSYYVKISENQQAKLSYLTFTPNCYRNHIAKVSKC